MAIKKSSSLLTENPLCGIGEYKDVLDLSTGGVTRRIKKLVLTEGEVTFDSYVNNRARFVVSPRGILNSADSNFVISDRYNNMYAVAQLNNNSVENAIAAYSKRIYIYTNGNDDINTYKTYLAAQYAAGTPVTVWYVLATPETETITVPSGLTGTIEGYLTQSGTPTPSAPIYPEANPALVWAPTNYRKFGTETDTITSFPAQIIGDGQAITSCQISGNTLQGGTPTPSDPVDVQGVGEMTENLFYKLLNRMNIDANGRIISNPEFDLVVARVTAGETYSVTGCSGTMAFYVDEPTLNSVSYNNARESIVSPVTIPQGVNYVAYRVADRPNNAMFNAGATPIPYEPYGMYKLPISCGNATTNIYLGEVESTRRVKKLVLTGEENFEEYSSAGLFGAGLLISEMAYNMRNNGFCTHFTPVYSTSGVTTDAIAFGANSRILTITLSQLTIDTYSISDTSSFKSYLAAQYAAGTPVTIWYVLSTPETSIINEPLMKIGYYADTVTATNVPTTGTPENFDVQTTLKPSEVQMMYHGWHEHEDTKYTQGE